MNELVHSRYFIGVATVLAVALSLLFYVTGMPDYPVYDAGIVRGWGGDWLKTREHNLIAGLLLNIAIIITMLVITRRYNLLRSNTKTPGALYAAMMVATPTLMISFYPGLLVALAVLWCMWLIYSGYADGYATRQVFLVFLILSGLSAVNYAFAIYIPVFILGIAQMRIFTMRSILATFMGIVTPWIIALGSGFVPLDQLQIPVIFNFKDPTNALMRDSMLGIGIFTALLGLSGWLQGLIKMISYNARSRAMLSLLWFVMMVTIAFAALDYEHIALYLPLLNCCAALELGHMFGVVYNQGKSYIAILCIMGVYLFIYTWRILLYIL